MPRRSKTTFWSIVTIQQAATLGSRKKTNLQIEQTIRAGSRDLRTINSRGLPHFGQNEYSIRKLVVNHSRYGCNVVLEGERATGIKPVHRGRSFQLESR